MCFKWTSEEKILPNVSDNEALNANFKTGDEFSVRA